MTEQNYPNLQGPVCPIPLQLGGQIVIGHGSGGGMTRDLILNVFQKYLGNAILNSGNDSARVNAELAAPPGYQLVVSTDAHVVFPLFFPGGDIGRLSVCGTVNDVAMLGAQPKYLTASFILEEGFSIEELEKILASMRDACTDADVRIIAADTKVTEKGKADKLFITTTGIGWVPADRIISGNQAQPGDAVLISGALGNHGIAVLQARGNLGFQADVQSDTAPLNHLTQGLCAAFPEVHVMRDPTRGGLATTLVEIAEQSGVTIQLNEPDILVDAPVQAACDLLGLDPLYLANEGKVIVILPEDKAEAALSFLRTQKYGEGACQIGRILSPSSGRLLLRTALGTTRVLDMLAGEMLPRIC